VLIAAVACGGAPRTESERASIEQDAALTLQRMTAKDSTLSGLLRQSAGYIVFPEIGKAGLVAGAAHGRGVLYENGRPAGYVELSEASFGAQIGAQTFAELIVFRDSYDVQRVKTDEFSLSANASAVVLDAGVAGSAVLTNGVAVFVMPRGGVMAELAVGGQRIDFEPRG
jgi:lipid-binding SYLF domain-containing protein